MRRHSSRKNLKVVRPPLQLVSNLSGRACGSQGQTASLRAAIQSHRASFINETDFADMAASGINAVRLPVGYWALEATAVRSTGPRNRVKERVHFTTLRGFQWPCA